ncbi:hypothetical protein PAPYR_713 [Paratrimastix pyriformis]|uniref:Uncharacterized protein n=1 Tax=Paratrimastix pyriformis TaxID=342808 RepID=A0ABQ8UU92_9EUKA|nr:hypothetical protein PAPYR_713 [Paratrimastix pyriformis]
MPAPGASLWSEEATPLTGATRCCTPPPLGAAGEACPIADVDVDLPEALPPAPTATRPNPVGRHYPTFMAPPVSGAGSPSTATPSGTPSGTPALAGGHHSQPLVRSPAASASSPLSQPLPTRATPVPAPASVSSRASTAAAPAPGAPPPQGSPAGTPQNTPPVAAIKKQAHYPAHLARKPLASLPGASGLPGSAYTPSPPTPRGAAEGPPSPSAAYSPLSPFSIPPSTAGAATASPSAPPPQPGAPSPPGGPPTPRGPLTPRHRAAIPSTPTLELCEGPGPDATFGPGGMLGALPPPGQGALVGGGGVVCAYKIKEGAAGEGPGATVGNPYAGAAVGEYMPTTIGELPLVSPRRQYRATVSPTPLSTSPSPRSVLPSPPRAGWTTPPPGMGTLASPRTSFPGGHEADAPLPPAPLRPRQRADINVLLTQQADLRAAQRRATENAQRSVPEAGQLGRLVTIFAEPLRAHQPLVPEALQRQVFGVISFEQAGVLPDVRELAALRVQLEENERAIQDLLASAAGQGPAPGGSSPPMPMPMPGMMPRIHPPPEESSLAQPPHGLVSMGSRSAMRL